MKNWLLNNNVNVITKTAVTVETSFEDMTLDDNGLVMVKTLFEEY
jgi:hypothetical protein